jgi:hypothetical protein
MARFAVQSIASGNGLASATARMQFGANDLIDWNDLPVPNLSQLPFTTDPATGVGFVRGASKAAKGYAITHPLDLLRVTQGPTGGWFGNFAPGDPLLFTNDRPPPVHDPLKESIVVYFRSPVRGVGVQFQGMTARPAQNPQFRANMVLWHSNRKDWGQPPSAVGFSDNGNNGSAVFLSAMAATPVVSAVQFYVDAMNGQQIDFALGNVSILV